MVGRKNRKSWRGSFEEASHRKTRIEVNKRQLGVVRVTAWYKLSNLVMHKKVNHLGEV